MISTQLDIFQMTNLANSDCMSFKIINIVYEQYEPNEIWLGVVPSVVLEMMLRNIFVNSEDILNDKIPDDPQPSISILLRSKFFNRRLADPGGTTIGRISFISMQLH